MLKIPTITLYTYCQSVCHFVLLVHAFLFVSDMNGCFIYGLCWLRSSLWLTTVKPSLPSCNPTERIKCVQVARPSGPNHWPISSNPFTFIIFIQIFSYLCEYMGVLCNVVATFVLVLPETHTQNTEVIYFL